MSGKPEERAENNGLNPSLRGRGDKIYDTTKTSRTPAETASVQRGRAPFWPLVWAIVTLLCVIITVWLLIDL